eukprot:1736952-Pleurochrysis_carterae.AAC.1
MTQLQGAPAVQVRCDCFHRRSISPCAASSLVPVDHRSHVLDGPFVLLPPLLSVPLRPIPTYPLSVLPSTKTLCTVPRANVLNRSRQHDRASNVTGKSS